MLNNMLLNKQWITEEIKEEIKKKIPRDKGQQKHNDPRLIVFLVTQSFPTLVTP